jgi:hypothetical protein
MEEATGQPKEDFHDYYKRKFLTRIVNIGNRPFEAVGETKKLNTTQFSMFLEKVKADAATEFGINLPLPNDRFAQDFIADYKNR